MPDIRDIFGDGAETVLAENREVAELSSGFAIGPIRRELADRIVALGIHMKGHILPRGSEREAAEDRFPTEESLPSLLARMDGADPEELRNIILILAEWGGGTAADRIATVLECAEDPELRSACLLALGMIGGPASAAVLEDVSKREGGEGAYAKHRLSELRRGGTIDMQFGDAVKDLPPEERERHAAKGRRIPLGRAGDER